MRATCAPRARRAPQRVRASRGARVTAVVAALASVALAACRAESHAPGETPRENTNGAARAAAGDTTSARDDFGASIALDRQPARRIVSLGSTTTEILFALGVGERLVGRSHWDTYPAAARRVPDLGNAIGVNVEAVLAARPDLVVLYASAGDRPAADALRRAGVPVVALKMDRIADFARGTMLLGALTGTAPRARALIDGVGATLDRVRAATADRPRPRVLWPLVGEPLYVIGGGSFLSELVTIAGGANVFADQPLPSPQVAREAVLQRDADVVLVGPRGAERLRADPAWQGLRAVRTGRLLVYDTGFVQRPSVQLGEAAVQLARLLHPTADLRAADSARAAVAALVGAER